MRIAEISTPEFRQVHRETEDHQRLLSEIEATVKKIETHSAKNPPPDTAAVNLRQCVTRLSQLAPFSNSLKLQIWKLSYRLWNACVDISNTAAIHSSSSNTSAAENHAKLRHVTADLLSIAYDVTGVPSPAMKSASFYYKTGLIWHNLRKFDLAAKCFERATDLVSNIDIPSITDAGERKLLLDLNLARSKTAWEVRDPNLAVALLNRSKNLASGSCEHYQELAKQYTVFGKCSLSAKSDEVLCF